MDWTNNVLVLFAWTWDQSYKVCWKEMDGRDSLIANHDIGDLRVLWSEFSIPGRFHVALKNGSCVDSTKNKRAMQFVSKLSICNIYYYP